MGFLGKLFLGILQTGFKAWLWIRGTKDQQIGRQQQQLADEQATNQALKKELADSTNRPDVLDSLRDGSF